MMLKLRARTSQESAGHAAGTRPPGIRRALPCYGMLALLLVVQAGPVSRYAYAQATVDATGPEVLAAAATDSADGKVEEVVITGSHIERDGFDSPTPLTVLGGDEIKAAEPQNLADFVNSLPSIRGSADETNSQGSLSSGAAGEDAMNLRGLGTVRTLVLVDGKRSAPASVDGVTDINTIPQSLVKQVEVVTGGASAAYGSGAIGGVVNFILDKKFTGLKASADYGEVEGGLDSNRKFTLTAGTGFASGRGQLLFSGESASANGISGYNPSWNTSGHFVMLNPYTSPGQPYYLVGNQIGVSTYTPGGLITAGPLKGTYFGVNGSVNHLAYGAVSGQFMQGGDWQYASSGEIGSDSLLPSNTRRNAFGRASFDITPNTEVYGEASYARYEGFSYYIAPTTTGITIRSDNAYLPASVASQMAPGSTFTMGTSNGDMPPSGSDNIRATQRYVVGADGQTDLFGKRVKWDLYYQKSVTTSHEELSPTYNTARLNLATDAVKDPITGNIVCRSTLTDPANGCVPLDRLGVGVASQAALNYVLGDPLRLERFSLDEVGANFTTNDVQGWAGPISFAVGAEGRREAVNGYVPPQYQSGWKYGNYLATVGHYSVGEGYVETVVPLLPGLDFNGAGRYTHYSTSGQVETWKTGLTYKPIEDITFRATKSRDIRAPNLSEMFSTGNGASNSVNINGQSVPYLNNILGSTSVKPEKADTLGLGIVLQPRFLPGFAASVDYYKITVNGVIGTVSGQQTADFCYVNGIQHYCDNIHHDPVTGKITTIDIFYENLQKLKSTGIDLEASYRVQLSDLYSKLDGALAVRALATHYIDNITSNGVTAINLAGANPRYGGQTPNWVYRTQALYKLDPWTFSLTARGISAGVISTSYVQCASACPASNPPYTYTINDNHLPGAIYFDTSIARSFDITHGAQGEVFVSINNVLNKPPGLTGDGAQVGAEQTIGKFQTNTELYDFLGRTYRVGLRINL